ncbi:Yos9p [Saccharomyces cerevisiae YJM1478]|uniref:Endoplasmic reticulum lectin n=2 Tax=Saccharomyces cerevisiae TaxID=4932 RepID=G2WAG1_YEASK|nr:Yos9p [Saccharomyces cerevisiae YJM1133]AJU89962.1 Yos9p [Saccharomyces cerevisiae YJM1304]AJV01289.1 Yos9p [Saccharomyces cerevisiae YJM1388]AJV02002.1 Yos9p [Saccharomyces cerevisiae YJM1389]AJV03378.1 Yos9p [Saccharomyces cerevisiae YJM1400]AJV04083.1 Yos9p [Saccharomyces cerevisiae YJM1401]AJV04795.1 Yos9p [Saccharomyces cerevisiae YJM1402]AJV08321.1 Yos9p [Saccharomyces cerevisiae YJM1433]AJV11061.1 Yos9p [Saccharomyces cerevisiae YJM1444]AJV12448.1 Yos9p [Saccharomyces cerevisiae 
MQAKIIYALSAISALIPLGSSLLAPIEDPIVSNKYLISYIDEDDWSDRILQNQSVMNSGYIVNMGDDLECFIQNASTQLNDVLEDSNEHSNSEKTALLTKTLNQGVKTIFDKLNERCIFYQAGFWIYEYCPGIEFVQFHGRVNTKTGEIVNRDESLVYRLGKPKANVEEREFELLYDDVGYYISEIIGSGDICDVTGAERMVEIQYVCGGSNSGPSTIQWVRETKICVYEAQVTIPELCNLELLAKNEDQKNASPILCRMPAKSKIDSNSIDLITKYEPIFLGSGIYFLRPFNTDERDKLMVTDNAMSNWDEITETYYQKFGNAINKMLSLRLVSLPNGHILQPGDSCVWLAEVVDMKDRFQTTLSLNILNSQRAEIFFNKTFTFNEDNGNFLSYKIGDHGESTELGQITHSNKADINTAEIRSDEYLINTDNELFLRISKEIAEVKELLNEIVSPHEMEVIFENMRNQPNNDFELALMDKLKSSLNDDNKVEQINNARMDDDESTSHTTRDIGEAGSQTTGNTESEVTNVAAGVFIEHDEL